MIRNKLKNIVLRSTHWAQQLLFSIWIMKFNSSSFILVRWGVWVAVLNNIITNSAQVEAWALAELVKTKSGAKKTWNKPCPPRYPNFPLFWSQISNSVVIFPIDFAISREDLAGCDKVGTGNKKYFWPEYTLLNINQWFHVLWIKVYNKLELSWAKLSLAWAMFDWPRKG